MPPAPLLAVTCLKAFCTFRISNISSSILLKKNFFPALRSLVARFGSTPLVFYFRLPAYPPTSSSLTCFRRIPGRQLPDPRRPLQQGHAAEVHDRGRRRRGGRPDPGAHGGDRRACAALRWRHLHPHRLRVARCGRQSRGPPLLRRG